MPRYRVTSVFGEPGKYRIKPLVEPQKTLEEGEKMRTRGRKKSVTKPIPSIEKIVPPPSVELTPTEVIPTRPPYSSPPVSAWVQPRWDRTDHEVRKSYVGSARALFGDDRSMQIPPLVILLRGAPGSGKSTWAQRYRDQWLGETLIISATEYFRDTHGVLHFHDDGLAASHLWCRNALYWLCQMRIPRILVDNTHITLTSYAETERIAMQHQYRVFQYVCHGVWQNTSGVPEWKVAKMRAEFVSDMTLPLYNPDKDDIEPRDNLLDDDDASMSIS